MYMLVYCESCEYVFSIYLFLLNPAHYFFSDKVNNLCAFRERLMYFFFIASFDVALVWKKRREICCGAVFLTTILLALLRAFFNSTLGFRNSCSGDCRRCFAGVRVDDASLCLWARGGTSCLACCSTRAQAESPPMAFYELWLMIMWYNRVKLKLQPTIGGRSSVWNLIKEPPCSLLLTLTSLRWSNVSARFLHCME